MFHGIIRKNGQVQFKINGKVIDCPKKYNDEINDKLNECPKNTIKLFGHIINDNMIMQDIIDFNMDEQITWQFIKTAITVSNYIRKE